jgi:hypothetical protein
MVSGLFLVWLGTFVAGPGFFFFLCGAHELIRRPEDRVGVVGGHFEIRFARARSRSERGVLAVSVR